MTLLPATVSGLWDRFNELFCEFIHDKKREHWNELVLLFDELKQRKGVSRKEYTRLNNSLPESLDDAEDEEEVMGEDHSNENEMVVDDDEVDELTKFITSTLDYVTQSDKKELTELLKGLKGESSEAEYLITLINLEGLIGKFLTNGFEDGKPVLPLINELVIPHHEFISHLAVQTT